MKFNRRKRFAVYGGLLMSTAAFMALVNGGSVGALTTTPTTGVAAAAATTTTVAAATTTTVAAATTTTVAAATTTTVGPTTTTTVGLTQTSLSGTSNDTNNCSGSIDPDILKQGTTSSKVGVGVATSAFPQPHKGQPIKLTKTAVTVSIGGSTLQAGVLPGDAGLKNGDQIPSTLSVVIAGSNTTEGTQTVTGTGTATVKIVNGIAQDLVGTTTLTPTTWHPKNATDPVSFSEKSMHIVSKITIATLTVTSTLSCTRSGAATIAVLSAQGAAPPTTTPTTAAATPVTAAAATTTTVAAAANTLPRTGANGVYLLIIAAALVDAGAALLLLTRRRRRTT